MICGNCGGIKKQKHSIEGDQTSWGYVRTFEYRERVRSSFEVCAKKINDMSFSCLAFVNLGEISSVLLCKFQPHVYEYVCMIMCVHLCVSVCV